MNPAYKGQAFLRPLKEHGVFTCGVHSGRVRFLFLAHIILNPLIYISLGPTAVKGSKGLSEYIGISPSIQGGNVWGTAPP